MRGSHEVDTPLRDLWCCIIATPNIKPPLQPGQEQRCVSQNPSCIAIVNCISESYSVIDRFHSREYLSTRAFLAAVSGDCFLGAGGVVPIAYSRRRWTRSGSCVSVLIQVSEVRGGEINEIDLLSSWLKHGRKRSAWYPLTSS